MQISVIYNILGIVFLPKESVKNLKLIDKEYIEIIFILQESSEDTFNFISQLDFKFAKKKVFVVSTNQGAAYGYNMGISYASHEYIIFASPEISFLDNFQSVLQQIENKQFDIVFFNGLENGDEKTFKDAFRKEVITIRNLLISKRILKENHLFLQNYSKFFFDFVYKLIRFSSKILIVKDPLVTVNQKMESNFNSYDVLLDATKIFYEIESLNDEEEKEYYQALATMMILYKFLIDIKRNSNNNDTLKYAVKNANIVISNIYPEYKTNQFLLKWKNEKISKFILNFEPSLKYCLREL